MEYQGEISPAKKTMTTRRRERTKFASLAMVSGVFMLSSVLVLVLLRPCRTDASREAAAPCGRKAAENHVVHIWDIFTVVVIIVAIVVDNFVVFFSLLFSSVYPESAVCTASKAAGAQGTERQPASQSAHLTAQV